MRIKLLLILIISTLTISGIYPNQGNLRNVFDNFYEHSNFRDGDIIFHISLEGQGRAVQLATKSEYTHVGMIFWRNNNWYVLEAVQPVRWWPLKEFMKLGDNGHYVVKRLKDRNKYLTPEVIQKMKIMGDSLTGKDYDIYFDWSDKEWYCSELVWKLYFRAAGVEVGKLQKMREFDLTSAEVKKHLDQRFGKNVPLDQNVISPASIFDSELLETIESNAK